jgi:tRNA pseudouridine13 synthase
LSVCEIDKLLGIEVYASKTPGVGGIIKESAEDFVVEEVLVDGSKASVTGEVSKQVLGSTASKQRFLLCILVKHNWDTFIATKNIAKTLGIDQSRVQFAGIKDAKAITAQHITLEGVSIEEAQKFALKDIQVHPIGYIREMLALFYLLGNNFTITIKHLQGLEPTISENIGQTIQELEVVGGLPNFFGHQRFGTTRPITHLVGKALINGDFERGAMLFLANPSVHEHPISRQARQVLQDTHDFKVAQVNFPRQLRFEGMMLNHLAENPTDYVGAFQKLPLKLQALFVQAHQSYLFNRFLSARIKHYLPLNAAVEGDFVVGVERCGLPLNTIAKVVTAQSLSDVNAQIKIGKLRVALPIFGVKQMLSKGIMGQIEEEVLNEEGISTKNKHLNELSRMGGKGGLRPAIAPIKKFQLQNVTATADEKTFQAKVSFMLLRGCYATIVLREIMKPCDVILAGY